MLARLQSPLVALSLLLLSLSSPCLAQSGIANVTLLAHLDNHQGYSDCWGYRAPDGREYAILGAWEGTSIIETTDPANAVERAFIPGPFSQWRDMKTYQQYLYVVNESSNEMQIIDLSGLPQVATLVAVYPGFASEPHNIYIDVAAGVLYGIEDFNAASPVRILSLADPVRPAELAILGPGLGTDAHDAFAQNGILYVAEGVNRTMGFFDVSDPTAPRLLRRLNFPNAGYVHSSWVTPDQRYMITAEETAQRTLKLWDIQSLNDIKLVGEYLGGSQLAHNPFILGDFAYISHYQSGLKIIDIADPRAPIEAGSYDTHPQNEQPGFAGAWGTYPYTQHGVVYVSDIQAGLFVVKFNGRRSHRVYGVVRDAATNSGINNARLKVAESGTITHATATGVFATGYGGEAQSFSLEASAFGYSAKSVSFTTASARNDTSTITLAPAPAGAIAGTVRLPAQEPAAGHTVYLRVRSELLQAPIVYSQITDAQGHYRFDNLSISDGPFAEYDSLWLAPRFPYVSEAWHHVSVTAGATTTRDFQLQAADIVLVNDDPLADYSEYYRGALAGTGLAIYEWQTASHGSNLPVTAAAQLSSRTMIWFTGDASTTVLSRAEQDSLARFLDRGGRLFLSGQNLAQSLFAENSAFLRDYLHLEYLGNTNRFVLSGAANSPIAESASLLAISGVAGANNQISPDVLQPVAGGNARPAFTYLNSTEVGAVTVANAGNASKIVFFGFGFEAIPSSNPRTLTRPQMMQRILAWFDLAVTVADPSPSAPAEFRLEQNYPNPFNPETTIQFTLPYAAAVSLKIYNLNGQLVTTLISGELAPGNHRVQWQGRTAEGRPAASGVYVCRLQTEGLTLQRKLTLLR